MWMSIGFQNGSSPSMVQLILFHDHAMIILILIISMVGYLMSALLFNNYINRFMLENQLVETVWTIVPALILLFIALPSLRLLYILDEVFVPSITLKVVGHQWFWSYEYSDYKEVLFDSYMLPVSDLTNSSFRVLEVDNRIVTPMAVQIRALVTAADVIHAWTIPSLGVKVDAVPGRLNQLSFSSNWTSLFYGQCSEICGANHSFMPIVLESIPIKAYLNWVSDFK